MLLCGAIKLNIAVVGGGNPPVSAVARAAHLLRLLPRVVRAVWLPVQTVHHFIKSMCMRAVSDADTNTR
jgi:hypothetical protein